MMNISSNERLKTFLREYDILLICLPFLLACVVITEGKWLSPDNILNVVSRVSILGLLAIGQSIVILSGQMDLSMASSLALFCSVYSVVFLSGLGIIPALVVASAVVLCIGSINGVLASRTTIPSFVITLGTMMVAHSMHLYVLKAARYLPQLQESIYGFMNPIPGGEELFPVFIWICLGILFSFVLGSTRIGRHTYAVGGNERVSFVTGVPVRRVKMFAFVFSSILVCVASFVFIYKVANVAPGSGEGYLLDTIAAPIIGGVFLFGGRGKLWKALMGALFLEVLTNFMRLVGVDPFVFPAIKGVIIAFGVVASIMLTPMYLRTRIG